MNQKPPSKHSQHGQMYLAIYPVNGNSMNEILSNIKEKANINFPIQISRLTGPIGIITLKNKRDSDQILKNSSKFSISIISSYVNPEFLKASITSIRNLDNVLTENGTALDISDLENRLKHPINIDQNMQTILFAFAIAVFEQRDQIQKIISDNNRIKLSACFYTAPFLFKNLKTISFKGNDVSRLSLPKNAKINVITENSENDKNNGLQDDFNSDRESNQFDNDKQKKNINHDNDDDLNENRRGRDLDNSSSNQNDKRRKRDKDDDENQSERRRYDLDDDEDENENQNRYNRNRKRNGKDDEFIPFNEDRATKIDIPYDRPGLLQDLDKRFITVTENEKQDEHFEKMLIDLFDPGSEIGATFYSPRATFSYTVSDKILSINKSLYNFLKANERNLIDVSSENHKWVGGNFFFNKPEIFPNGIKCVSRDHIKLMPTVSIGSHLFAVVAHILLTISYKDNNGLSVSTIPSMHTLTIQSNGTISQILNHQIFFYFDSKLCD